MGISTSFVRFASDSFFGATSAVGTIINRCEEPKAKCALD
jgi:hypothetical protein